MISHKHSAQFCLHASSASRLPVHSEDDSPQTDQECLLSFGLCHLTYTECGGEVTPAREKDACFVETGKHRALLRSCGVHTTQQKDLMILLADQNLPRKINASTRAEWFIQTVIPQNHISKHTLKEKALTHLLASMKGYGWV